MPEAISVIGGSAGTESDTDAFEPLNPFAYICILQRRANTNTNIIRVRKFDRMRKRILFVSFIMTEYEYEYYSGSENLPNTNTNIIWSATFDQI